MAQDAGTRLIGVYSTEDSARSAADAVRRAGVPDDEIRIGDPTDYVASVASEMRDETTHTIVGPGNVGPFTKEMSKGMLVGIVVGGAIGVVLALPLAAIPFGDFALWSRLLLVVIVGALVGATVGWVLGGGFGATRPDDKLAAERGVTLTVPATPETEALLSRTNPLRLDVVEADGQPVRTIATEEEGVMHKLGRHAGEEPRRG
jgi:hypothetical protein